MKYLEKIEYYLDLPKAQMPSMSLIEIEPGKGMRMFYLVGCSSNSSSQRGMNQVISVQYPYQFDDHSHMMTTRRQLDRDGNS